ncbi:MAG: thiamine pyrophosphate-requiring protein [Candidatus Tectomicrobia bacterium]|uniref:Thiamine pyrophosphate-requiring protein n=1 Tax=Tectimicrobiota bacterium TaxID=2528274 RepID=A0A932HVW7_UNCTE|nr:thiamine pyrophosphate-requiring protein [Candidatus Tectomicrobia bacterium]
MEKKKVAVETTAEAYLTLLAERGVDYFFGNGGTDFPSIIEALAKLRAEKRPSPIPILAPHEMTAVSMAHGYAMVTGRPQLVMVHVSVGTANSVLGIINANRLHVPMLFTAGRTPITESGLRGSRNVYIHWAQEAYDQAAMVREFVKWDYELRNFEQLETVVDRALGIASSHPQGPVYLTLPREVLAQPQKEFSFWAKPRTTRPPRLGPEPEAIAQAAEMIAGARHPILHVGAMGHDPCSVKELVALAELGAFPVVEDRFREFVNFPSNHPLHQGYSLWEHFKEADVILTIESSVPWIPSQVQPRPETRFIQLGVDPNFSGYPIRGFPADLSIQSEPAAALAALREALRPKLAGREKALAQRREALEKSHKAMRAGWKEEAEKASGKKPIDYTWLSRCIADVLGEDDILVNEYDMVGTQLTRTKPGTYFDHPPAAGLGWGMGAALGAKLAAKDRTVIATVGDGSYIFSNPAACHWAANAHKLPFLAVVFNNRTWGSVKRNARALHPDGWAAGQNDFAFTSLEPSPDFEKICQANGGYGEKVEDPGHIPSALQRALKAVREEGRQALLNVICEKP